MDQFIPRKFKLISDYSITEDVDLLYPINQFISFDDIIKDCNKVSVILGEPASGKTFQLKEYQDKNSKISSFLKTREVDREKNKNEKILLFDSIDESLVEYPTIKDKLLNYIEDNSNKKFIITCRYLERKDKFEEEFQELDKKLKVYEIAPLTKEEINKLLPKDTIDKFWDFISKNYLEPLLKNILIIKHLVENFKSYNNTNYLEIYEDIAKEYLSKVGKDREEQDKDISLEKQLLIASSLATYMTLNKKESIKADKITANKLYKIDNDITLEDLESVLNTALFQKSGNEFKFFHKSMQEYLTAYFINYKKLDFDTIKQLFAHKLRFYEEFEEVIIYLTNIEARYFKYIVEFDPFVYRRHPLLTKEQQEKLFKSIIKNLIKNEKYFKDRQVFLNNTTLVTLDKINPFEFLSKDDKNNILKSDNEILLFYILRVFSFHYSKNFENFIFKILEKNSKNKKLCSYLMGYAYNENYEFNKRLFDFMKKYNLFYINIQTNKAKSSINVNREINNNILKNFLQNTHKINDIVYILKYIEQNDFEKTIYGLHRNKKIDLYFIVKIFNYFIDIDKKINRRYQDKTQQNIQFIIYLIIVYYKKLNQKMLINIDKIFEKYNGYNFFNSINKIATPLFTIIKNDFWELYFNGNIKNINNFLEIYTITTDDINEQKVKYPITKYFFKYYDFYKAKNSLDKIVLSTEDKQYLIKQYKETQDESLLKLLLEVFDYSNSNIEAEFIFEIYQKFKNDIEKCRDYIKQTLNIDYEYNLQLFNFMQKNNLFIKKEKELIFWFKKSNEIENWIFNGLYGLWFKDGKVILNKNNYQQNDILYLFKYITYYHFFNLSKYIDINDIKDWFDYFCENYDEELLQNNGDYANSISWLAYKLLIEYNVDKILLEKIIIFFKNTKLRVKFRPSKNNLLSNEDDKSPKPLFFTIENNFWDIYFSNTIKSFEEIKNFVELYHIKIDNLEEAQKRLNISEENKKYQEFKKYLYENLSYKEKEKIEYKQNIESRNYAKVYQYVLDYIKNNNKKIDFKEIDKKLKNDLKDEKYQEFLHLLKDSFEKWEISSIKSYLFERDIEINNYYSFLLSIVDINELNVDIQKIFWLVCLNLIVVNDNIKTLIQNNFETFIKVAIEYNKLFFSKINDEDKKEYLNRKSPINNWMKLDLFNEKFVKLFDEFIFKDKLLSSNNSVYEIYSDFIKNLDELDFLLAKHFFLEILSLDKNSYDFIKSRMDYSEDDLTYYSYLAKIDKNRAKKDLENIYNHWIKYDAINFVNNLHCLKGELNKDINVVLNDFFVKVYNKISYNKNDELEEEIEKYFKDEIQKSIYKNENYAIYTRRPIRYNKNINQDKEEDTTYNIKQSILEDFCKNKNCEEYNIVKIKLFDKLLNNVCYIDSGYIGNDLFSEYNIERINEKNKKRILIDYYKFYNEDKIPIGINYDKESISKYMNTNTFNIISLIWHSLYEEKNKKFLEDFRDKSENKYIKEACNYGLLIIEMNDKNIQKINHKNLLDNYKNKKDRFFEYDKLRDDLIEIALTETNNRNAIYEESENETNDRFRNALKYKKYNVADQSRGGESSTGINAGERDLVIHNDEGLEESVIEAFILKSFDKNKITNHYEKLVKRYDPVGNEVNFILIYAKSKEFEKLWEKYIIYDKFNNFEDTKGKFTKKTNLKVGISKNKNMKIYHIFINFYSEKSEETK